MTPLFSPGMPLPAPDAVTGEFWKACREHRLVVQKCVACGTHRFSPGPVCSECHSFDYVLAESRGVGEVFTYTIVHHVSHPATRAAVPYNAVVVRLADCGGVKLVSNLVDCDNDDIHVGMLVELAWDDVTAEVTLPRFKRLSRSNIGPETLK